MDVQVQAEPMKINRSTYMVLASLPVALVFAPILFPVIVSFLIGSAVLWMVKPKIANKVIPDQLHPVTTRTAALATSALRKINIWREGENKYTKPTAPLVKKAKIVRRASKTLRGEPSTIEDLMYLQRHAHYEELIVALRRMLKEKPELMEEPFVQQWVALRFRNIFIREAAKDTKAVEVASADGWFSSDTRSPEEKVTYRYIKVDDFNEWQLVHGTEHIVPMPEPMFPEKIDYGVMFVPGLLNGMLPVRAFRDQMKPVLDRLGVKGMRADVHPMRGCEQNVVDIKRALKGDGLTPDCQPATGIDLPEKFITIGYSKGCPDLLTAFRELPEMRERCVGMFSWAGAYGGSFLANDIYNTVKDYDTPYIMNNLNAILEYICPVIDLRKGMLARADEMEIDTAVGSLTTIQRDENNQRDRSVIDNLPFPIFNITGSTSVSEVPYFQVQGTVLLNLFDSNNDMQLTQKNASVVGKRAFNVAMMHGNHWDLSYPEFPPAMKLGSNFLEHPYPKEAAFCAIVSMAMELGLLSKEA